MKVVKYRNMIEKKLAENKKEMRKSVVLTENLRAAQVRYCLGGSCVAQRKHSCIPPSGPGLQHPALPRFFLFTA